LKVHSIITLLQLKNKSDVGSIPESIDKPINYKEYEGDTNGGYARFFVSLDCNDGTYKDENCSCKACSLGCTKCNKHDFCNHCDENAGFMKKDHHCVCKDKRVLNNGKCQCVDGFYENDQHECVPCEPSCEKCTSATHCEKCKEGRGLKLDENNGTCVCSESSHVLDNNGTCQCPDGQYENNMKKCVPCGPTCEKCTSAINCIKCKEGKGLELDRNRSVCVCKDPSRVIDNDGTCQCPDGQYENDQHECVPCEPACEKCTSATHCEKCKEGRGLELDENNGTCVCSDPSRTLNNSNGTCQCIDGFYETQLRTCVPCESSCEKCTSDTYCEKCKESEGFKLDENKHTCVCSDPSRVLFDNGTCQCKISFYEDPKDNKCKTCPIQCASCNQEKSCTTCKDPKAVFSDGVCVCQNGFLLNDTGYCFFCDASCDKCDSNGCITCRDSTKSPNEHGKCE